MKRYSLNFDRAVLCLVLVLSGCGKVYSSKFHASQALTQGISKVAVLSFNDLTGQDGISPVMANLFSDELSRRWGVEVIQGDALNRALEERRVSPEDTTSRAFAAKVAEALGVQAVIFGDILEYRYRKWFTGTKGMSEDPVVCLSARMVNGRTGTVVWAGTNVRTGYAIFSTGRDPLSGVAELVVRDLVKTIKIKK